MAYSFFVILIIMIIIIFNHLNNKIRKLEDEISELNKKITDGSQVEKKGIQELEEQPQAPFNARSEPKSYFEDEPGPDKPLKDRVSPVLDFLKQNALTIIGIFTLVLGISYFVKYAIDKNWIGETGRVGIGVLTGAAIMAVGYFLRRNYTVFSSILTGGGIAVLYFTITIAFREYHLFSQNLAFSITCLITLISIALSYWYKSEVLIIFSLFGGFLAPLMVSTGQSNYLFLFSYLTVLNTGMLAIVFLKHWKSIGWVAFIFTNAYLFYWTAEKTDILSVYFYMVTYIIFYAFALQNYSRNNLLSSSDILMLVLINFSSILGLVYTFNKLHYEPVIIFPVIFAVLNGLLLGREYRKESFGADYSVFTGITISLITIAVALQFKTHLVTSVWAIEATLLLFIWKKTGHTIFKRAFYILFPLAVAAQMITWSQYLHAKDLSIIFNPVFLTSTVMAVTIFINLFLLRKLSDNRQSEPGFFENTFTVLSYGVIYIALLLEITYHLSERPLTVIACIGTLFTVYYIFILLLFRKLLNIGGYIETGLFYTFSALIICHTSLAGSETINDILERKVRGDFYGIYLLYLIPFIYFNVRMFSKTDFFKKRFSYWIFCSVWVVTLSFELYHLYILGNVQHIAEIGKYQKHFSILFLPVIWAILASVFIYTGIRKNIPELNKTGFTLVGITVLKLYAYDVWQMDNISRIIAFTVLGIILLLSSFLFQRLKRIIKTLVERNDDSNSKS